MNNRTVIPLFRALDTAGSGAVSKTQILAGLQQAGIQVTDQRLRGMNQVLSALDDSHPIDLERFARITSGHASLLERALKDELVIPQFAEFTQTVEKIYEATAKNVSGDVATYIPQLARVNPEQFGVAVCTIDGQRLMLGDAATAYCFQSTCKPMLYSAALDLHGEEKVHRHVGREPSGMSFNELSLNKARLPHNPMVNAGAIMSTSLLKPEQPMAERFEYVMQLVAALSGGNKPGFNNSVFHSERDTADRNFALAHYMREVDAFPVGTDIQQTLELYFACCSMETTAEDMASIAVTFANGGVCPQTGEQVFGDSTVKNCLSMMYSCGMYDYSGEFAFRVGIPAKSGVSGAIMAAIPNVMGIAVWSPRLDELGNSVRGVEFLERLIGTFNLHNYDSLVKSQKIDPRQRRKTLESNATFSAIQAASCGDIEELKRLVSFGLDLNGADYDGRTPLHLAAAEGQEEAVRYLLRKGVALEPTDRWGNTPLDDAERHSHKAVAKLLHQEKLGSNGKVARTQASRRRKSTMEAEAV